jgi:hypothetical protein
MLAEPLHEAARVGDAQPLGALRLDAADAESDSAIPRDGRVGSSELMAVVEEVGTPVGSVDGLYDLSGKAAELRAAADAS